MSKYYEVHLARYELATQDSDTPGKRYHTGIFVETNPDRSGTLYQVTGDITSAGGMIYKPQPEAFPKESETFHSLETLGFTPASKHPGDWERVLSAISPPPKQKEFNIKTMRTEPFKTLNPLTFYAPGEPKKPLMKCTEWTLERALPALRENGLIIQN